MQQQNSSNEMAPPTLLSINYQTPVMRTATRCSTTEPIQTTSGSDIQQGYTHIRTPFKRPNTALGGMRQGGKKLRFTPSYEAITPPATTIEEETENVPPEMFIPFEHVESV